MGTATAIGFTAPAPAPPGFFVFHLVGGAITILKNDGVRQWEGLSQYIMENVWKIKYMFETTNHMMMMMMMMMMMKMSVLMSFLKQIQTTSPSHATSHMAQIWWIPQLDPSPLPIISEAPVPAFWEILEVSNFPKKRPKNGSRGILVGLSPDSSLLQSPFSLANTHSCLVKHVH